MLKKYLQQIRQGKPVHYGRMLELLPPLFYQKKSEMFKVRQLGSGRWQVNILSEALFSQLEQQALKPASRKEAAQIGDSHQVNTSFGYQLVYHQSCLNRQPEVVVLDGTDKFQSYQAKPTLLLIENEECFSVMRSSCLSVVRCWRWIFLCTLPTLGLPLVVKPVQPC